MNIAISMSNSRKNIKKHYNKRVSFYLERDQTAKGAVTIKVGAKRIKALPLAIDVNPDPDQNYRGRSVGSGSVSVGLIGHAVVSGPGPGIRSGQDEQSTNQDQEMLSQSYKTSPGSKRECEFSASDGSFQKPPCVPTERMYLL